MEPAAGGVGGDGAGDRGPERRVGVGAVPDAAGCWFPLGFRPGTDPADVARLLDYHAVVMSRRRNALAMPGAEAEFDAGLWAVAWRHDLDGCLRAV